MVAAAVAAAAAAAAVRAFISASWAASPASSLRLGDLSLGLVASSMRSLIGIMGMPDGLAGDAILGERVPAPYELASPGFLRSAESARLRGDSEILVISLLTGSTSCTGLRNNGVTGSDFGALAADEGAPDKLSVCWLPSPIIISAPSDTSDPLSDEPSVDMAATDK